MPLHSRVFVVDAERVRAKSLVELLAPAGYEAYDTSPGETPAGADVVLLSLDTVNLGEVTRLAAAMPDADLILLVGAPSRPTALAALGVGACDVVEREAGT